MDTQIQRRPGRKVGAEKRRIAKETLRNFYTTDDFLNLPSGVKLAMLTLCPKTDTHPYREEEMEQDTAPLMYLQRLVGLLA